MPNLNPGRHDPRRTSKGRVDVVLRGSATGRTTRVITEFVHTRDGEFVLVFLMREHGRLGHASIAEAVKDVNVASILGSILKHRIGETREDVVNLAEKQGQEPLVAITEHRDHVQHLMKMFPGSDTERIAGGGLHRQILGQGAGYFAELVNLELFVSGRESREPVRG